MSIAPDEFSPRVRVADPDEGITLDELRLASRNHAMPLEAMRADVTPPGLHYVLVHYDIPAVDPGTWSLEVTGAVDRPLSLDLGALASMPSRTVRVTLECAGNGRAGLHPRPISQPWLDGAVGTADWTGVPLAALLDDAGLADGAREVVFTGADHGFEQGIEQDYERALDLAEATGEDVIVAFAMNGEPLPLQHGFPVRLVVPGWYGMTHVKWLRRITVIDHAYTGYQNAVGYRMRQAPEDPGEPVTRIQPRALLVPPGVPDFMTRDRVVRAGQHLLEGRAWSGWGPVVRVQLSPDDGASWLDAELDPSEHRWAWRRFTLPWEAVPGRHVLRVRAHDSTGRTQLRQAEWNRGGYANTSEQAVTVHVLDG